MAGVITEDYGAAAGGQSVGEGMSSEQRCQSGDLIAEWRSSEQIENGTPSTSPSYWDTDDDDDCGPKPAELFGRFTWKIESFSTINKRELRSNAFEVGGYKWYILIYPQGCDVCNHLSLFLCVANHDKLLPGWSHLAQFTIAVVNKDLKKSKYSDTLHRFWKKEHDWGWKKFMELSKVHDGFVNGDALVIKAQVQVIREKSHRPFRCLDCQYRRELVRVYLSNVEQICRRFIEEKTARLSKLIEDKINWPSFRSFWLETDPDDRLLMSREQSDVILKVAVKHFFIEKEVTSTLVMDSLYSGLKALECQSKGKDGKTKILDLEKLPPPMVCVDKDMFVLADDALVLLARAVKEPLSHQPLALKDDKCSQNRTKDGSFGEEFSKDSFERDERRLMELGRRTVEIFVLFHIYSKIEVSYQEAVALVRQEELIREEEEAGHAENDLRTKRGGSEKDKDKRSRKKQAKQKRNSRKGKDKSRNGNSDILQDKLPQESPSDDSLLDDSTSKKEESVEKIDILDSASDVSENGNVGEAFQPDLDDRNTNPVNWDTDTSEVLPPAEVSCIDISNIQIEKRIKSALDDSSSTCSTDSVPSVVMNGSYKGSCWPTNKVQTTPNRGKSNRIKEIHGRVVSIHKVISARSGSVSDSGSSLDVAASKVSRSESNAVDFSLKNEIQRIQNHLIEKDEEVAFTEKELIFKDQTADAEKVSESKIRESPSLSSSVDNPRPMAQQANHTSGAPALTAVTTMTNSSTAPTAVTITTSPTAPAAVTIAHTSAQVSSTQDPASISLPQGAILSPLESKLPPVSSSSKSVVLKHNFPARSPGGHQANAVSRPSSAPLIPAPAPAPAPRAVAPVVSTVQSVPLLSRSASAAGRLGTDPSPSAPCYVPQSYRNAIFGKSAAISNHQTVSSSPYSYPPSSFIPSSPVLPLHTSTRTDTTSVRPVFTFGSVKQPDAQNNWKLSRDDTHPEAASSSGRYSSDFVSGIERVEIYGSRKHLSEIFSKSLPYQAQGLVTDEFPHLDIINDLLDDENGGRTSKGFHHTNGQYEDGRRISKGFHHTNGQYSFPYNHSMMDTASFSGLDEFEQSEQLYYDGFGSGYASPSSSLQGFGNGQFSHADLSAYANCQFEGVMQNQWPYAQHSDLSLLNLGKGDTNQYPYQLPDYSSLVSGVNGYVYRPASGP